MPLFIIIIKNIIITIKYLKQGNTKGEKKKETIKYNNNNKFCIFNK